MTGDYLKLLKRTDKIPVAMDIETLDLYCEYLLNYSNRNINYSNLTNLKDYFSRISDVAFKNNEAKMARYLFITKYLEARLEKGSVSYPVCMQYVYNRVSNKYAAIIKRDIIESIEHNNMGKKDVEFMNSMIFGQLNTFFMHDYQDALTTMLSQLKKNEFGTDPDDANNAIKLFQHILNDLTKAQRRSKQENRFNLTDVDHFNAMMLEAAERAVSESHFLQTGWQGFNKMLGGGLEDARLYNFIGATGGFKSGLLLNLMKQIKIYNKGRPHKDPTKRPTILFISQENNIWETFLRIFGIFGKPGDIKRYNPKDILKILKDGGFTTVQDDMDIDIEFMYYGNMDIGVNDLRGIVQELENSGKEVIVIIQDYIERLRPPMITNVEKRNQLADVSNQLHDLALELDIPIVTASQFNREGVSLIEQARDKGMGDVGKKVGTTNISESFAMLKNIDVNISIVIEYDSTSEKYYLSFRRLKFRGDDTNTIDYFLQPFNGTNSKIQLTDDLYTEPVYRLTMLDEVSANVVEAQNEIIHIAEDDLILDGLTEGLVTKNDPDNIDIHKFLMTTLDDIHRTNKKLKELKTDDQILLDSMVRNTDGFIILQYRDKKLESKIRGKSLKTILV